VRRPPSTLDAPNHQSGTLWTTSSVYPNNPILYVTEVHERLVLEPLAALRARFEWSELNVFDIAGPTGRHGVLLGTKRWNAPRFHT
jgi:hypothetical protein